MNRSPIVVRRYRAGDGDELFRISAAAYGHPMSPNLRIRLDGDPGGAFVAERDGAIVGCVMVADYGSVGYVGSMAVDPAVHRSGAGTALMDALIAACEDRGLNALALDATDAGAPLYERFGFVDIDRTAVFGRLVSNVAVCNGGAIDSATLAQVAAIDRALLSCDRTTALAMLVSDAKASVEFSGEDGFAVARDDVLGPWIARSTDVARALLERSLRANPQTRQVFVPESNVPAVTLVTAAGFTKTRSLRHMIRGASVLRRDLIFGQASLGHG